MDLKTITGMVTNIEDKGDYQGRKKWRAYVEVVGRPGAFMLDFMDNSANPHPGVCPAVVGEEITAQYEDKEWTNNMGEVVIFHNYRWPGGSSGGSGGKKWFPKKPTAELSISKSFDGTILGVKVIANLDEAKSKAHEVNEIFDALYLARKNGSPKPAPAPTPAPTADEEIPF